MGEFFNFSLLDVWNHPVLKITRGGLKLAAKGISSANAKAENKALTTSELTEMINAAQKGDSNAQVLLAVHYAENKNLKEFKYWLNKSVEQGNEYALQILDMFQE